MKTFEYRHDPALSQEFINGACELGEVKRISIDGRDILYRVGSATLDNSCCGNYGCGYGLVIGERMAEKQADQLTISTVREISTDEPVAGTIRETLMKKEELGALNFYTSALPQGDAA